MQTCRYETSRPGRKPGVPDQQPCRSVVLKGKYAEIAGRQAQAGSCARMLHQELLFHFFVFVVSESVVERRRASDCELCAARKRTSFSSCRRGSCPVVSVLILCLQCCEPRVPAWEM